MKIIILLLISFSISLEAQILSSVYPDVPYSELYHIAVQGNNIYTAGSCDVIITSEDEGQEWNIIESPGKIIDIDVLPSSNGSKAVYLTTDEIMILDIKTGLFETISDDNLQLSAGKYKDILVKDNSIYLVSKTAIHKSTVGEYDWKKTTKFIFSNDAVIKSDITDNYIWIGSFEGKILKVDLSDDSYITTIDYGKRIYSLEMANDQVGYLVVKGQSNIQKTIDGGISFNSLENMPENISPVAFGDDVLITVNTNRLYVSTDGGQSSVRVPIPDNSSNNLINNHFISPLGVLYFVGRSSMVMKTSNYGQSFENLNAINREDLQDIQINDTGEGYAVGGYFNILHTEDNGQHWTPIELELSMEPGFIQSIVSVDNNRFLIGHGKGLSIIENTSVVSTDPTPCIKLLYNKAENYVIAIRNIGGEYTVSKSTDKGHTWIDLIVLPAYPGDLQLSNTGKIFISGDIGTIITSVDGGENWKIEDVSGLETSRINKIKFLDNNLGLISVGNNLYLTTDGGLSVNQIASGYAISNLQIFSKDHFMYTLASENATRLYESIDQGQNWKLTADLCARTRQSFYDGDQTVWLAQSGGHINKHTIINVNKVNHIKDLKPIHIYPNPTANGSTITFEQSDFIPKRAQIIESTTGKTIQSFQQLTNELNIQGLTPGIYMVVLSNEEEKRIAKLVIL